MTAREALHALAMQQMDDPTGHVYFIQGVDGGPIKIGWTHGRSTIAPVARRLATLQNGSPVTLTALAAFPGEPDDERALHRVFADARLHGEWFTPVDGLVELIEVVTRYFDDAIANAHLELSEMLTGRHSR